MDDIYVASGCEILRSEKHREWRGLKMTLQDATGTITAFLTSPDENQQQYGHTWRTVRVVGSVTLDKYAGDGALQIRADKIYPETPATMDGLIPGCLQGADIYRQRLRDHIESTDGCLGELLSAVFDAVEMARFYTIPAARSMHHAVQGGLLQHTVEVTDLAGVMARAWLTRGRCVDTNLVTAGALLHDIGKLDEYDGDAPPIEYGRGALLGHVTAGVLRVERAIEALYVPVPPELREQLLHIIVAHHGRSEHGAPVEPRTPEARIVSDADGQSAWIQAYHEATAKAQKIMERSPVCGYVYAGVRWGVLCSPSVQGQFSLTASREIPPMKTAPLPAQPSLFGTVLPERPLRPADDDLDDPFA